MNIEEQLACAKRELALRQRVYPRWVRENKMTAQKAHHEINAMDAIIDTLEKLVDLRQVGEDMRQRNLFEK